jgi:hypothetical protein
MTMIRRATGIIAIVGAVVGIGLIVLAWVVASEAGVAAFIAGVWILISALLFAGGYWLMGLADDRP